MDDKSINLTLSNDVDSITLSHKNSCIPSLGLDIGGTLAKLVFFEPDLSPEEMKAEDKRFSKHLESRLGDICGMKDDQFQLQNVKLFGRTGSLYFFQFLSDRTKNFISILKLYKYGSEINTLNVTGGGAFKYAELFRTEGNIKVVQHDEWACISKGIKNLNEVCKAKGKTMCYSIKNPMSPGPIEKVPYEMDDPYPFIATNIGTGASMTHFKSENEIIAKYGSPLAGSSFLGLCYLLTGCNTFDEAMELVAKGDHTKIDKSISDIYGEDFSLQGLPGSLIVSYFGKIVDPDIRKEAKKEDIARSLLQAISNNIGHIAVDTAMKLDVDKIIYCGSFLRGNPSGIRTLAFSTMFWSQIFKLKQALFLEHQGYLGATGALFEN